MKILILEDEIPAYKKLITHLNEYFEEDYLHDWARSNEDGEKFLNETSFDFILSDIQLLDGISFDLFDKLKPKCPIIFCSAHDEYLFHALGYFSCRSLLEVFHLLLVREVIEMSVGLALLLPILFFVLFRFLVQ